MSRQAVGVVRCAGRWVRLRALDRDSFIQDLEATAKTRHITAFGPGVKRRIDGLFPQIFDSKCKFSAVLLA